MLWKNQGYRSTRIQITYRTRYNKNHPCRSSVDRWYDDYRAQGTQQHRGGNGRPQLSTQLKSEIRPKFINDPTLSFRKVAAQFYVHRTTVTKFHKKELKMFPYKLQNSLAMRNGDGTSRLDFAENYCSQLTTSRSFLKKIIL